MQLKIAVLSLMTVTFTELP